MSGLPIDHTALKTRSTARSTGATLLTAIVLIALSQLPFLAAQFGYAIGRATINLDMLLALIIACWSRRLGMVVLLAAWCGEIARDASRNFHFADTLDFVDASRFAGLVSLPSLLSWEMIVALVGLVVCAAAIYVAIGRARRTSSSRRLAAAIFGFACLAVVADLANGSVYVFGLGADRSAVNLNIAGSTARNLVLERLASSSSGPPPLRPFEHPLTAQAFRSWKAAHPDSSVLLILVESMGLPNSLPIRDWLYRRAQTRPLEQRWKISLGSEEFFGPTTYGELRVLCALRGDYRSLQPANEAGCLPHLFAQAHQPTFGLHGFNMRMFDREHWWRDIGVAPQDFPPEDNAPDKRHCNDAFPGICDAVVLQRAASLADAPGRFVYALTLDTHLPLPWRARPVRPDLAVLCEVDKMPLLACRMVDRLADVLDEVAADMASMKTSPFVVVVGDHAPPFFQPTPRAAFDPGHVTMITFEPTGR